MSESNQQFNNFKEFYAFYLTEHQNKTCRRLHVIGSVLVLLVLCLALYLQIYSLLWLLPIIGYGFAWIGHFVFEKNIPATFQHPLYSFIGDWVMLWQVITGKIRF